MLILPVEEWFPIPNIHFTDLFVFFLKFNLQHSNLPSLIPFRFLFTPTANKVASVFTTPKPLKLPLRHRTTWKVLRPSGYTSYHTEMTKSHLKHPALHSKTTIATKQRDCIRVADLSKCRIEKKKQKTTTIIIIIIIISSGIRFHHHHQHPLNRRPKKSLPRHARLRALPFPAQDARRASAAAFVASLNLNLEENCFGGMDSILLLFTSLLVYLRKNSCAIIWGYQTFKRNERTPTNKNYKILVLLCTLRYPETTNVYRPSTGDSQIKLHSGITYRRFILNSNIDVAACSPPGVFFKLLPLRKWEIPSCEELVLPHQWPSHHPIIPSSSRLYNAQHGWRNHRTPESCLVSTQPWRPFGSQKM